MIVLSFLVLILVFGALVDVIRVPVNQVKRGTKAGWLLAVLLLPVIGGALWFAFGRSRGEYDLDEPDEETDEPESGNASHPDRAAEHVRSAEGPAEHLPLEARDPADPPRPRTTEEQLADLEAEIAYWDEWTRQQHQPAASGGSDTDGRSRFSRD